MKLTIQEVHTYNNLVKEGKAPALRLNYVDEDAIVIPKLDEDNNVYFLDLETRIKVYPGEEFSKKIKKTIDKLKNNM